MDEIRSRIREFLRGYIHTESLGDDEDMFANGYVNSLFVMQLVLFVEQDLGTTVEDDDLDFDNFRSIDAITRFVAGKTGRTVGA